MGRKKNVRHDGLSATAKPGRPEFGCYKRVGITLTAIAAEGGGIKG